jgi:hypothetical protein
VERRKFKSLAMRMAFGEVVQKSGLPGGKEESDRCWIWSAEYHAALEDLPKRFLVAAIEGIEKGEDGLGDLSRSAIFWRRTDIGNGRSADNYRCVGRRTSRHDDEHPHDECTGASHPPIDSARPRRSISRAGQHPLSATGRGRRWRGGLLQIGEDFETERVEGPQAVAATHRARACDGHLQNSVVRKGRPEDHVFVPIRFELDVARQLSAGADIDPPRAEIGGASLVEQRLDINR